MQFGRALGADRGGDVVKAHQAIDRLQSLREALMQGKQAYWADQVEIQHKAAMAWVARAEGKPEAALDLMHAAADLEGN